MPGWYIHMDVARKALANLAANGGAAGIFGSNGPDAGEITGIARQNPAYVALGAIGPDMFFLLPDFKPPVGTMLFGAANTIREFYEWWDRNFLGPWEKIMGPIEGNTADEIRAISGGLSDQFSAILSRAFDFLKDTVVVTAVRQYDVFSFLGSGVPAGYDEQAFFWSDMLHYRKTYEFAAHLWKKASDAGNPRFQAFALGWMSHLATDVTGHCFVNEKSGGPYRHHWQRHHLVENHMDGKVCENNGKGGIHNMLSNAALHLWIAFTPDGTSHDDFFQGPGPDYPTGDTQADIRARGHALDVDSDMPTDLGDFIAEALREVYNPTVTDSAGPKGQCASHPTIWESIVPGTNGYVSGQDIVNTYWWLYKYVKVTTTDYYKTRRPEPPPFLIVTPFPSPPGTGDFDWGPRGDDNTVWHDGFEVLLAILAWIIWLAEVAAWPAVLIAGLINSAATYPIRELLYEHLELPLYNAWLAFHWYLAMSGFVLPLDQELNEGLNTLGIGVTNGWGTVQRALQDADGGLLAPLGPDEPSGSDLDDVYPIDVVEDPQGSLSSAIHGPLKNTCGFDNAPSEFLRPWLWPASANNGDPVPSELQRTKASPYRSMEDCTKILSGLPGSSDARHDYEIARSGADTDATSRLRLPSQTLGDAVDYTAYVVAQLTRKNLEPTAVTNFNLDSDRGYGYLCWDWLRSSALMGTPAAFQGATDERPYHLPLEPGTGWCKSDASGALPPKSADGVKIRYIDREDKFA